MEETSGVTVVTVNDIKTELSHAVNLLVFLCVGRQKDLYAVLHVLLL